MYDCGVFVCRYARLVCEGENVSSGLEWLPGMRREILEALLTCSLSELPPTVRENFEITALIHKHSCICISCSVSLI